MHQVALAATAALALSTTLAAAESRTYDLDRFDRIDITAGLQAVVTHGQTQSVRVETEHSAVFDQLGLRVRNGELRAKRKTNLFNIILGGGILNMLGKDQSATIYITLPDLTAVSAAAGSDVRADLVAAPYVSVEASSGSHIALTSVEADRLEIDLSSGSTVTLAGSCDTADLDFSSGSHLAGRDLDCTDMRVDGSSGASATLSVSDALTGSVSSGASVKLDAMPNHVDVEASSGGNVQLD